MARATAQAGEPEARNGRGRFPDAADRAEARVAGAHSHSAVLWQVMLPVADRPRPPGVDMDHGRRARSGGQAVEPARLPVAVLRVAPASRMIGALLLPPARRRWASRRRSHNRLPRRSAGRGVGHPHGVDLEGARRRGIWQLVVEREAGAVGAPPDDAGRRRSAAAGRRPGPASSSPAGGGWSASRDQADVAVHVFVEQRQAVEKRAASSSRIRRQRMRGRRRAVPRGSRPARRGSAAARSSGRHGPAGPNRRSRPGRRCAAAGPRRRNPRRWCACGPRRIQNSANQARWPRTTASGPPRR